MVIKLDVRKILHGRPRMVTRDLFAVANLVPDFTKKLGGCVQQSLDTATDIITEDGCN